jgi:hypothetical protein
VGVKEHKAQSARLRTAPATERPEALEQLAGPGRVGDEGDDLATATTRTGEQIQAVDPLQQGRPVEVGQPGERGLDDRHDALAEVGRGVEEGEQVGGDLGEGQIGLAVVAPGLARSRSRRGSGRS